MDWKHFLATWSTQLMQSSLAEEFDLRPNSNDWLGFEPATNREIRDLEERLGVALPPSYKDFLEVSNGWLRTTPFIGRIRPTDEVDWFRVENERWVEVYSQYGAEGPDATYYAYGSGSAEYHLAEHMAYLLQISDVYDGVYLLNPSAVTPDGEWEAWFFANWNPGARRYPSFAHLMLKEYCSFANLENIDIADVRLPKLDTPPADVPRTSLVENLKFPPAQSMEALIEQMHSPNEQVRTKAVRILVGGLVGRSSATRRPDFVEPLTKLFYASDDPALRSACVQALTEWAEDGKAPTPLLDALSDTDPSVVLQGIFALTDFPEDRALEPLCRFIESRQDLLINESAMKKLAEIGSPKAVPTLVGVLLDINKPDQSFLTAAHALAECGQAGFEALVSALNHDDPRIRRAAVVGIDFSGNEKAGVYLDRALTDPDTDVRQRARMRMSNFNSRRGIP